MADETPIPRPFWRRRWLWAVVATLVVLRAAVPEVVRQVLVSRAAETLKTRVEVGDVDLAFMRGGVTLEDVALYSPAPEAAGDPPLVAWKRFTVALRYLPLLWKTIQLRTLELDEPRIVLDRLATGELNLRRLVPASEPDAVAAGPPPQHDREKAAAGETVGTEDGTTPGEWRIGIDRFLLSSGGVRFRDFTLPGDELLEIHLPDIAVNSVALQPGVYGEPAQARLRVNAEGGRVRATAKVWTREVGFALAMHVKALRLPLRRARLYVPGVGWRELSGECDAAIDYQLAPPPEERHDVHGMVRLRDVEIRIPDLERSAFTLQRLTVRVDPVDLKARTARIRNVDIDSAAVVVDLQGGHVLPLLRAPTGEKPPVETPGQPAVGPVPPPAQPWHWRLASLTLDDSRVSLLQDGDPLDVGVQVVLRDLADDATEPGHVAVKLTVPPGSVDLAGATRVTPPGFGGTLRIEQLPVHDLVRAVRAAALLPPGLLRAALLGADLVIEAGLDGQGAVSTEPHLVRVRGTAAVDGLDIAAADPSEFGVGWKRLQVPVDDVRVPGIMPEAPEAASRAPIRVALGAVRLEEPFVRLTRTAEGIALPPPLGAAPAAAGEATDSAAAAPAPVETKPEAAAGSAGRPLQAEVASFALSRGRIGFVDRTVSPSFDRDITSLEVDARGIDLAGPFVKGFTLSATTPQKGTIRATGSLRPQGGSIEVDGKEVALAPYNPFVTAHSPYSLGRRSSLSVHTEVTMAESRYDTDTSLTLHRFTVKGARGDTLFKEQFGIRLSLALALLRDLKGNIKLDVPMTVDESGTKVGLRKVIAGALRSALLGAMTSPLKLIGGAFGEGGRIESPSFMFPVGRGLLRADGERQVEQIAAFLASRPGVTLELEPVVTPADARWLAEQDLRAELDARTGAVNALLGLPGRGARLRIQEALAERAADAPGELAVEDAALLDQWLAERPVVAPERLRALGVERTNAIVGPLQDRYGIEPSRLIVGEAIGTAAGEPTVDIAFGAAE
jgi:hypothetical protein